MKHIGLFFLIAMLIVSCQVQKKQTIISKEGNSSTLSFEPGKNTISIKKDVSVNIEPVSNDDYNSYFKYLSNQSGKYDYFDISFDIKEYIVQSESDEENEKLSNMYQIIDAASTYCDNNDIPSGIKELLIEDIVDSYGSASYAKKIKRTFKNNPYVINGRYLSLFKLDFYNGSDQKVTIDINQIDFYAGNTKLQVYSKTLLKTYYTNANERLLIDRCNFPDSLIIYPGDSVSTFIATSPLEQKNQNLNVYISNVKAEFVTKYIEHEVSDELVFNHMETDKHRGEKLFAVYETQNNNYAILPVKNYDILLANIMNVKKMHVIVYQFFGNTFYMTHKLNINPMEYKNSDGFYDNLNLPELVKVKQLK